jgi:hypothetical protein
MQRTIDVKDLGLLLGSVGAANASSIPGVVGAAERQTCERRNNALDKLDNSREFGADKVVRLGQKVGGSHVVALVEGGELTHEPLELRNTLRTEDLNGEGEGCEVVASPNVGDDDIDVFFTSRGGLGGGDGGSLGRGVV